MLGVVLYPSGSGGSHLKHILNSNTKQPLEDYDNPEAKTITNDGYKDDICNASDIIIAQHMNAYVRRVREKNSVVLQRKVFLLRVGDTGSMVAKRMQQLYSNYLFPVFFNDMSTLYSEEFIKAINPNLDLFVIDSDLLWQHDIKPLLDYIKNETPVTIDEPYCYYIHEKWCEKVGLKSLL